jgi:predicted nucleic acid-binding protein
MPKVRTTITIDAEKLARWQAVATSERRSLSSILTQWLDQVVQSAEYVAAQVDDDRGASLERLQLLMSTIEIVNESTSDAVAAAKGEAATAGQARAARAVAASTPPPCNTGGKAWENPNAVAVRGRHD